MPHSKVMLHLPSGVMQGDSRDWEVQHTEMQKYKDQIIEILLDCGATRSYKEILADIDRDKWFEPAEAIDYGLADEIIKADTMKELLE